MCSMSSTAFWVEIHYLVLRLERNSNSQEFPCIYYFFKGIPLSSNGFTGILLRSAEPLREFCCLVPQFRRNRAAFILNHFTLVAWRHCTNSFACCASSIEIPLHTVTPWMSLRCALQGTQRNSTAIVPTTISRKFPNPGLCFRIKFRYLVHATLSSGTPLT